MSSSSSLSGGKYTRDLKLRVLEHYFRNGGDVFGNKQSTAKKFGIVTKTINRFLQIPELVRLARKNAKSSKSAASGSSDGFKEPLLPGASGSGGRPRPQRQSVRITLPSRTDESIVGQSADPNSSSIIKLLKIFELGTQEIRDLLAAECDLIYECRACRALFRSVADLLAHKRRYCTRPAADSRQLFGSGPGQSLSAASDGVLVLPLAPAVDRLPEVRQAAAAEARAAAAQPVPPVRLDPLPGSAAAVLQTVGEPERSVAERLAELRQMEAAADRTVRLGRDGRVVETDEEEEEEGEGEEQTDTAETEDGRHVCQHCNTTFSTRKTLSHHVRSLHSATRVYYPCSLCSAAFINMFSVERHLQKVHKKKQEEIDVLKEGIKQKSFQRNVSEIIQAVTSPASGASSAAPAATATSAATATPSTNAPVKITSFEWKCRQCSRRYLSLPVGLQHVQSVHPQFSSARAGLVRVCRIVRQTADSGAVSTRSSSGAVTPADREPRPTRGAARDADTEMDGETSGGDSDGRMLFNKANLLKRLASGGERCVLCRKVFTGHLQACGHLRLHDQPQIEAYLGKKVRFIRKRRPADAQTEPEEYELDGASGVSPTDGDEQESEADAESVAESDAVDDTAEDRPAAAAPASVESRGFPVQMVAAERVRRRHFVHALPGGEHVCTLCEARFPRWPAARAHLARHSRAEVANYVKAHAVSGLVGVPASLALRPTRDAETAEPVIETEPASDEETEEQAGEDAEGAEEEEDEDDEDIDMSTRGETGSVDTDIEAGAKLLVSCKLWSPGKRRRTTAGKLPREEPEDDAEEDEEDYDDDDGTGQESIPLTQELDGEIVDKWMVMRTKGLRLRCIMCNKTFMRNGYAEIHLGTDHTFEEVRDFLRKWGVKGVRVPPRTGEPDGDEDEESDAEEPEDAGPPKLEPQVPQVKTKANVQPAAAVQKGTKRPAEAPALAAAVPKVAKREPTVLNVSAVKTPGSVTSGAVGPIGPNTRILKISRSDLLQKCEDGARVCLVCDRRFESHPDACEHMRQHSDADIRNFIKTRGREFLPAFEERQKQRVRRLSESAAATGPPTLTPPAAITPAVTARSLSVGAADAPTPTLNAASVAVKSSKPATPTVPQPTKKPTTPAAAEPAPPDAPSFHRDEAVNEFEMFDKGQLLKRQPDGTKCLLCTRVFAKHSSACGHLSHHGEAEVQAWRGRMRKKASALLQLARRPRAYGDAEDEKDATAAAGDSKAKEKGGAAAMDVSESGEVKEEDSEQTEAKKAKADNSPAKTTKASATTPVRATRRKDSVPVKVTRITAAASDKEPKTDGTTPAKAPSTDAAKSGKVVTASLSEPKTLQVIHGSKGTGKLLVATEKMANKRTKGDTDGPSKPDQKNTTEPPVKTVSPATQKAAEASVKSPGDKPAADKPSDKTPAKTGAPSATPVKASQPAVLSSAAGTVMVSLAGTGTGAVSVVSAAGGTPLRTGQLLKLPQGMLKVALLQQAADGTLQTAGGRHVMQLAPGVKLPIRVQGMKLPITAANLPRVLRPIAPKEAAVGVATPGAGPGVLLQPPTPGTLTISGPLSPPRPRPPPLLRAPLMQMASGRAPGGSITVHIPASLKTTATSSTSTTGASATATAPQSTGAQPAGKDGVQTNVKSDSDKRDAKTDVKAEKDTVDAGQSNAKADGKKNDKSEVPEKRPPKDAQSKITTVVVQVPGEAGVKSDKESISEADAKPAKRQGETKGSAAKAPASAAASRPATVTKRAFIPEVSGKAATRCSWTPEPGNKSSPRAAAAASSETTPKTSPPALPPGEVPQTRARAEAAVAARMRQTRRASASAAADKK